MFSKVLEIIRKKLLEEMELLTVLNDYNAKNREEIHLIPFFYFLF